jgi:hypothetical protein
MLGTSDCLSVRVKWNGVLLDKSPFHFIHPGRVRGSGVIKTTTPGPLIRTDKEVCELKADSLVHLFLTYLHD